MISLRIDQLVAMTGGTLFNSASANRTFTGVSIDSRTLKEGELFIAIKGERNDGHDYIAQAIERGAAGIVSDRTNPRLNQIRGDVPVVTVENSHDTMIDLAHRYRKLSRARVAGITGSNGKTTTKEYAFGLASVVNRHVYRSPGNFNNLFGMPLALFAMPNEVEIAILELGISTPGEMTRLGQLVQPDVVTITNVGASHTEFLGTVEDVARAKLELVSVSDTSVPVVLNGDDPILMNEARKLRSDFVTFAIDNHATFRPDAVEIDASGQTVVTLAGQQFRLPLPGRHQVYNLLAAYATVCTLGYDLGQTDLSGVQLATAPMRGETLKFGQITIVADCYNANPQSMDVGLQTFFAPGNGIRRILILGDMLELGPKSREYHAALGRTLAGYDFHLAMLVGPMMRHALDAAIAEGAPGIRFRHFDTAAECASAVSESVFDGDAVFIKASRGTGLDLVLKQLTGGGDA